MQSSIRLVFNLILTVFFLVILLPIGFAKEPVMISAKKITEQEIPTIDGKIDKVWDSVEPMEIELSGEVELVNTRIVYTAKEVYFLFEWEDYTKSVNRLYTYTSGTWEASEDNVDSLNILWNLNMDKFNQDGCQILCHKEEKLSAMHTRKPGEKLDLWRWRSQLTNPLGYADDQYMQDVIGDFEGDTTGKRPDSGRSGYFMNWDSTKKRPLYIGKQKHSVTLFKDEAIVVNDSTKFPEGMVVPKEALRTPEGSRADLKAKAIWEDDKWTLELKRALSTKDLENDVQFTDLKKGYIFGISIHEDGFQDEHATADLLQLNFK